MARLGALLLLLWAALAAAQDTTAAGGSTTVGSTTASPCVSSGDDDDSPLSNNDDDGSDDDDDRRRLRRGRALGDDDNDDNGSDDDNDDDCATPAAMGAPQANMGNGGNDDDSDDDNDDNGNDDNGNDDNGNDDDDDSAAVVEPGTTAGGDSTSVDTGAGDITGDSLDDIQRAFAQFMRERHGAEWSGETPGWLSNFQQVGEPEEEGEDETSLAAFFLGPLGLSAVFGMLFCVVRRGRRGRHDGRMQLQDEAETTTNPATGMKASVDPEASGADPDEMVILP